MGYLLGSVFFDVHYLMACTLAFAYYGVFILGLVFLFMVFLQGFTVPHLLVLLVLLLMLGFSMCWVCLLSVMFFIASFLS